MIRIACFPAFSILRYMKAKTEEFLYLLLWSCEMLSRPTWRNLTESFEGWAYRRGLLRQLAELERRHLVESQSAPNGDQRILRLTASGRLRALGGRDPEAQWSRPWDGKWRLVLFDVPNGQEGARSRLRRYLKSAGFGYLQKSVWITPDPLAEQQTLLRGTKTDVESLILLEARPCAGETDEEIVSGAWDFAQINRRYARHLKVLEALPSLRGRAKNVASTLRNWASEERLAWWEAVSADPLLPGPLLPAGYLGRQAWWRRIETLAQASTLLHFVGI